MNKNIFLLMFLFQISVSAQNSRNNENNSHQNNKTNEQNNRNSNEKVFVLHIPEDYEKKKKLDAEKNIASFEYLLQNREPLTIEQQKILQNKVLSDRAKMAEFERADEYISDIVHTSLQPGEKSIKVNLSRGLPVTIVFKKTDGSPINYYNLSHSGSQFTACRPGSCSQNGSIDDQNVPKNILILKANQIQGGGNLPILTTESDFPLSLNVSINEKPAKNYVDRLVVMVNIDGDDYIEEPTEKLKSRDKLTRVLNDLPPEETAERLNYGQGLKVWKVNRNMWIRTSDKLLFPIVGNKKRLSLNGINVYQIPYSNVISLINNEKGVVRYTQVIN